MGIGAQKLDTIESIIPPGCPRTLSGCCPAESRMPSAVCGRGLDGATWSALPGSYRGERMGALRRRGPGGGAVPRSRHLHGGPVRRPAVGARVHDARSVQLSWRVLRSGDAPADGATDRRGPRQPGGRRRHRAHEQRTRAARATRRGPSGVRGRRRVRARGCRVRARRADTSVGRAARIRWTLQELVRWVPRHLRVDGVVRLAPHMAALALMWAGVRRRVGLGR